MDFSGCELLPADLMIFAELCEAKLVKNASYVNLSENIAITDDNFVGSMARVIKALRCNEVIIKNSDCEEENIREIKNLLGIESSSSVNFSIS